VILAPCIAEKLTNVATLRLTFRVARTPAQRGKVGNWLVEARLARGWDTQERARAEIGRLIGWQIPQSVYAEWESGRRVPSEANLERLQGFYGTRPTSASSEDSAVAAAIDRQTEVLRELIELLRSDREASQAVRERVAAIEAYAEEHERRLQADRQLMGLGRGEDPPTRSPLPAGSRS
jgi:hypothetical protein